jgi:DEAD/DEAH box helicase
MTMSSFHPAVARWFESTLGAATEPQLHAWPAIAAGEHALIAAPTGSGKTLAAFLFAIDGLVRAALSPAGLPDQARVLYVSPLRALSHDVDKNLQLPLTGIAQELSNMGLAAGEIRTWVRTGDTSPKARAQARKRSPHIVVTTPESLYVLLTSESGRAMLRSVRSVIRGAGAARERRLRDARPVPRARHGAGVVRAPPARAHPPRHPGAASTRDRAGLARRVHALPGRAPARRARHPAARRRRAVREHRAAERLRPRSRRLGRARAAAPRARLLPRAARPALVQRSRGLGARGRKP